MVAAWISADTGVGPSMASSSQDCSGTWADLPQAPSSSSRPMIVASAGLTARHALVDVDERRRAEGGQHQHDRDRHAQVADPVDHEGLLGRGGRGRLVLPEADQQVRGQADALPADEQHQVVVGQDQQQHGGDEQVEEGEEPAPPLVVGHVADRVDVDQAAHAGDQQHEDDGQLVDQQPDVDVPLRRWRSSRRAARPPRAPPPRPRAGRRTGSGRARTRPAGPGCRGSAPSGHRPGRPAAGPRRSAPGWRSAART